MNQQKLQNTEKYNSDKLLTGFDRIRSFALNKYGAAVVGASLVMSSSACATPEAGNPEVTTSSTATPDTTPLETPTFSPTPTATREPTSESPVTNPEPYPSQPDDHETYPSNSIEISTDTPIEKLGTVAELRFTEWLNAENSEDLQKNWLLFNGTDREFFEPIAKETAAKYAPILFGDDWESKPAIKAIVTNMIENHISTMFSYCQTLNSKYGTNVDNIEPFKYWSDVIDTKIVSADSKQIISEDRIVEHTNIDKNIAEETAPRWIDYEGHTVTVQKTFVSQNGRMIIDSMLYKD